VTQPSAKRSPTVQFLPTHDRVRLDRAILEPALLCWISLKIPAKSDNNVSGGDGEGVNLGNFYIVAEGWRIKGNRRIGRDDAESYIGAQRYQKRAPLVAAPIQLGDTGPATLDCHSRIRSLLQGQVKTLKLRHTAVAFALLGWYLMVPPQTRTWWIGPQRSDDSAPLTQWTNAQSFDKAQLCEAARVASQPQSGAVCVATDDPRLKTF
jgi:hypothetical protein